jgi:3-oxoacyl-[acyl-carrier protein] reductase
MKKILITGTTQGIGRVILDSLLDAGYICSVVNKYPSASQSKIENEYICDLSNLNEIKALSEKLKRESYFALINNAGAGQPILPEELTAEMIYHELQLNFVAPFLLIQALLPNMKANNVGRIINISSVAATMHVPLLMSYSASKAGLNSLTHSMAKYLKGTNITLNAIAPGAINTESAVVGRKKISSLLGLPIEKYQKNMINAVGREHLIEAEELCPFIKAILDDKHGILNGQRINLSGLLTVY